MVSGFAYDQFRSKILEICPSCTYKSLCNPHIAGLIKIMYGPGTAYGIGCHGKSPLSLHYIASLYRASRYNQPPSGLYFFRIVIRTSTHRAHPANRFCRRLTRDCVSMPGTFLNTEIMRLDCSAGCHCLFLREQACVCFTKSL